MRKGLLHIGTIIGGLGLLGACGAEIEGKAKGVDRVIKQAWENGAYKCQPKHLTLAESNLRFARDRLDQGFPQEATSFLSISTRHAKAALVGSPPEKCKKRVALAPPRRAPPPPRRAVVKILDTDGDGILDNEDKCPKQPEDKDGFEDEDGCPDIDNDADGIADKIDKCPGKDADKKNAFKDTKEDKDGFEDDDGCPDLDNDKDGIADKIDQCPNKPEDKDGFKDDDGCPDPDNDNDKICDPNPEIQKNLASYAKVCKGSDKCPLKPEVYNQYMDEDGCPDKKLLVTITKTKIELSQKVYFAYNKSRILRRSFQLLRDVGTVLKDNATIHVRIEGHTDSRGRRSYNRRLSHKRARSVYRFLIKEGIDPGRMIYRGFGEDRPIANNRSKSGREKNRRVEFVITKR